MSTSAQNTRTIARNSFWYGFEVAFSVVAVFAISIPMARVLGPDRIGYFNLIAWLTGVTGVVGSAGIPTTTRKYVAEYLGKGELGVARGILGATLKLQIAVAGLITLAAVLGVHFFGDPAHRLVSTLQVLAIFPAMVDFIGSSANVARENLRANVFPSVVATSIQVVAVTVSLSVGWDLVGIAAGMLLSRVVELIIRFAALWRWMRQLPSGSPPDDLKSRMRKFSAQSMVIMLFQALLWDRSDVMLLKLRTADVAQITFFSIAFNLTEKVLLIPHVFAGALGTTMMVEYGREKSRLSVLASEAGRYLFLSTAPVLIGLAAVSSPVILTLYGKDYAPVISILALAAVFALPKALLQPAQLLLQVHEKQGFMIMWSAAAGVVNIVLDYLLIPQFGALGAVIGNGVGQTIAVAGMWLAAIGWYGLRLDGRALLRISIAVAGMSAVAVALGRGASPVLAILVAVPAGAIALLIGFRLLAVFTPDDRSRLSAIERELPRVAQPLARSAMEFLIPS
jgi:O-antigen/teichoic acid export membrane protein